MGGRGRKGGWEGEGRVENGRDRKGKEAKGWVGV